jgi:uncharacterized membrane protein YhhN
MMYVLGILITVSAVLAIYGKYTHKNAIVYVCKPLTTILITCVAAINSLHYNNPITYFVLAGLGFSLLGDIFLMLPDLFLYGLSAFVIAQISFMSGFLKENHTTHILLLLPFIIGALAFYSYLYPGLHKYKYPALAYIIIIALMSWRAWECYVGNHKTGALIIGAASLLFIFSDANLAVNKFKKPYKSSQIIILSTYYISIWLIAAQFSQLQ